MTHSVIQIAEYLEVSVNIVYKAIYELQMVRHINLGGKNYYTDAQLLMLKEQVWQPNRNIRYYPLKTTETFYIYQSKLNTIEL